MFIHNRSYTLQIVKTRDFSQYEYVVHNAIYVGSYTHFGKTSHRFLHLVNQQSFVDFVGLWSHVTGNYVLCGAGRHEEITGMNVLYTDVYEYLLEKQNDLVIVKYPRPTMLQPLDHQ